MLLHAADDKATYKVDVADFTELVVVDGVNVEYHASADSAGRAYFVCPPQMASSIHFDNSKGRLSIRSAADETPIDNLPTVTVYSHALRKVENSGDSIVEVFLSQPVDDLKIKQIGNGTIKVHNVDAGSVDAGVTAGKGSIVADGKAKKLKISNVSAGPVEAAALEAPNVTCMVFGSGNIECNPTESLRIFGAGSGKVYYVTAPTKITNRGIGVRAKPLNEKNN